MQVIAGIQKCQMCTRNDEKKTTKMNDRNHLTCEIVSRSYGSLLAGVFVN